MCIPLISSTGHGDASLHRLHYQDGKFALANLLVALLPKNANTCDAKYLYYLLTAKKDQYFVPLMLVTANVSLKERDIAEVEVELPPILRQREIVKRLEELEAKIEETIKLRHHAADETTALLSSAYNQIALDVPRRRLEEVAPLKRRPVNVDSNKSYPQVAVRSFGRGTFHKPLLNGNEITWQKPFLVREGDILVSNIKAWEGAIAVASTDDDGRVGSHRYLTFVPVQGLATARFICFHLLTPEGLYDVGMASPGSADRNRTLNSRSFLDILVPVPDYDRQTWFDSVCRKVDEIHRVQSDIETQLAALMPSILENSFRGEL